MIRLLLARGADPNLGCSPEHKEWWHGEHMRPIDTAAAHGHTAAVEALIEGGATYSLAHTVLAGMFDRTRRLLDSNPALLNRLDEGAAPLHHALNRPEILHFLLDRGAYVQVRDVLGRTPLHRALEEENGESAAVLLERGAEVDLFAAVGLGDEQRALALLKADPAQAHSAQADGMVPLFYAAYFGAGSVARALLRRHAEANLSVRRWWMVRTPLHAAVTRKHAELCRLLLDHGADIEAPNGFGYTPLRLGCRFGDLRTVRLLLDRGANVDAQDSNGTSSLAWAAWVGDLPLARLLIRRGADINLQGAEGTMFAGATALHYAARHGRSEMARLLLASGASLALRDRNDQTPLACALVGNQPKTAALLRRRGATE